MAALSSALLPVESVTMISYGLPCGSIMKLLDPTVPAHLDLAVRVRGWVEALTSWVR